MAIVANYMVLVESGDGLLDGESAIAKHLKADRMVGGISQKLTGKNGSIDPIWQRTT
jgi:hypothetical protein